MDRVEVYEDEAEEYRWRRKSENGQIVAVSGEGYETRSGARDAAQRENPTLIVNGDAANPRVTESKTAADYVVADGSSVLFDATDSTTLARDIRITRSIWEDLGQPSQITVSIVPGNQLGD